MRAVRSIPARVAILVAAVLVAGPDAAAATSRVLLLHSFGRDVEAHAAFARSFRTELAAAAESPVVFYEMSMATATLGGTASENRFVDYLSSFESDQRFDLVVALGGPAARFVQRSKNRLFVTTPLLIAGTETRHLRGANLSLHDAAVPLDIDLRACFENVLRLLPETKEILVVAGATPLEKFWIGEMRSAGASLPDRVRVTFLDDLPFERMLERAADAPAGTAIFFALMHQDASGVPYAEENALVALRGASHAPIFGIWDFQVGKGTVGGPVIAIGRLARESAAIARRILEGESPSKFRTTPEGLRVDVFDARELAHWKIDRSRLPAGSEIRFAEPSFWERYRWRILAVAALCVGQGLLILWLVAGRMRVRSAEAATREVSRRLISAQEDERARLARELHDDVTQQLARLAIDAGRLASGGLPAEDAGTVRDLRAGLVRLSENVHVLSYSLHPSILDDLGLAEAIQAECDRVADHWAVPVEIVARGVPASTPIPVSRCLYRVAQEALRNVIRHAGAREVHVRLVGERRGIRLTILDDGAGFDVSAHRTRPTLGLASMRERVRMAGGTFAVASAPGRGTTVDAWVPLEEPPA